MSDPTAHWLEFLSTQVMSSASRDLPGGVMAALAAAEEEAERERFLIERRNPAQTSALKALGLRRSQVHFKCDNSAKV